MIPVARWACVGLLVCIATGGVAQSTNSGDIRGVVTDPTGAIVPGAKVTVLNVNTGVSKDYTSDSAGLYDTSSIVDGSYKLTFSKEGFEQLVRGPVTVQVGFTTVNGQLTVGSTTQQVVVNDNVPLLNTESGEQSTTLEAKTLQALPETGQDWENFVILLPGASGSASSASGMSNPGQFASVNGNLPYNGILADGASASLPNSMNADLSILETIGELQVVTSAFSAQYSMGGMIYNQISKGGTDKFHGALYEYFQNDALNARNYAFGNQITVPFLRYNNYGGSIGGPILKKKMFFYFNYDKTDSTGSNTGYDTVPTVAMMNGDFTGQPTIYDPTTQVVTRGPNGSVVTRKSFAEEYGQGNKIPGNLLDPVARNIQSYYPTPTNHTSVGRFVPGTLLNGIDTNNYYYSISSSSPFTKYFGRLDYDISPTNRLTVSDTQRDNPALGIGIFACPVGCSSSDVDSNNAQISDVWNISPTKINEARLGYTDELDFFAASTTGQGYPAKIGLQFAKADIFPTINISGQNCCTGLSPGTTSISKEFVFDPSDVFTIIHGRHVLHFGGEFLFYRDDRTAWGNINGSTLSYTGVYTQSTVGDSSTGVGYADFLLGQTQSWNAAVQPEYGARLKSPQMFIQDDVKLKPNLTVNVGLRYQIQDGWHEVKNNASVFDPTVSNPATQTKGAMWYAQTAANGRHALLAPTYNNFLPRAGFSWLPYPNTTVRGGVGLYSYQYSLDDTGDGLGNAFQSQGSATDQTNGISPVVILSSSGSNLPYVGPTTNPAALNGQSVQYNKYHTPLSKSIQWNFAMQRTLGSSMVGELAYVASHGFDLAFPNNLNQVPENLLGPNDSPQYLPYPQFEGIGGLNGSINAVSNYHSLQASINKRQTGNFSYSFNYVWSHFLTDQDSSNTGGHSGNALWQRSYNSSANYGNSNFDVRNAFKGNGYYLLPFGKGQLFFNHNTFLDAFIGGWHAAGTIVLTTGNPFTPTVSGSDNSYSQGSASGDGYAWFPNQIGNPTLTNRSITKWFDPSAYTIAPSGSFGDLRRNSIYGPGLDEVNLSAGKTFSYRERYNLEIRADATNAFNHPSFGLPNSSLVCTVPGVPCTSTANVTGLTVGGRTMQLSGRFTF
jgi:hypothetical protein